MMIQSKSQPILLLLVAVFALMSTSVGVVSSKQLVPSFVPTGLKYFTNGSNFTSLILVNDEFLFIGAKDSLFRLDARNIAIAGDGDDVSGGGQIRIDLLSTREQREKCLTTYYDEKLCANFVQTIVHRPGERDLYACGTYSFSPRLFQLSYDLTLLRDDDGYGYCSLNPLDSTTAVWIADGNPGQIASLYSASLLDASTKTQPVEPVIYRPELKPSPRPGQQQVVGESPQSSYQYLRTPKFDSDWLYQPHFVDSFDVDDQVWFFLRERSLEQMAEGEHAATYARVVRVCKSDQGAPMTDNVNQWTSLRKTRLTCSHNHTYLDQLERVVRVNEDTFAALFVQRMPGDTGAASFVCEFTRKQIAQGLNAVASNFKEVLPGTLYWSRVQADRIPQDVPNTCNYNSQMLSDRVAGFLKTHCLIGDHVEGSLVAFAPRHVTAFAVDDGSKRRNHQRNKRRNNNENNELDHHHHVHTFYLGTRQGRVLKMSSVEPTRVLSEWDVEQQQQQQQQQPAREALRLAQTSVDKDSLYLATDSQIIQVSQLSAQCLNYALCDSCMRDPDCGWSPSENKCAALWNSSSASASDSSSSLLSMEPELCARFQAQKSAEIRAFSLQSSSSMMRSNRFVKVVQAEAGEPFVRLACGDGHGGYGFLAEHVEWRKDDRELTLLGNSVSAVVSSRDADLVLLAGNATLNGIYSCHVVVRNDENGRVELDEMVGSAYSVTFIQTEHHLKAGAAVSSSKNQKCITADDYIQQYNNWCDEYSRYQRSLNEWEDLKDKSCSSPDTNNLNSKLAESMGKN